MAYVSQDDMIEVFQDTEEFCKTDENLKRAIADSIKATKFYGAKDYPSLPERRFKKTTISVVKRRSFDMAVALQRKHLELKIAVHNFASATNPGGGVKNGSRAQEESLCRCSTLYPVLDTKANWEKFYTVNRELKNPLHDDACIYTPEIVICKNDTERPSRVPRDRWELVDVITIAAPNLRKLKISDEELFAIHEQRLRHMFTVVAHHGADIFVTGAFGCGAFHNNPEVVASAFQKILPEFEGCFKEIVFAIYYKMGEMINYDAFKRAFK